MRGLCWGLELVGMDELNGVRWGRGNSKEIFEMDFLRGESMIRE